MNNIQFLFLYMIVSFSFIIQAQVPIVVSVTQSPMRSDTQYSFKVIIPQTELKEVRKEWMKYLNEGTTGLNTETNGQNLQVGVTNKNISAFPLDIYSTLTQTTDGVLLNVWLAEQSTSNEPNDIKQLAIRNYIYDFALPQYRNAVQLELKQEQEKQKQLENELSGYINKEEKSI